MLEHHISHVTDTTPELIGALAGRRPRASVAWPGTATPPARTSTPYAAVRLLVDKSSQSPGLRV